MVCEVCQNIILRKTFYSPRAYLNCLDYIRQLVDSGDFVLESGACGLDKVKDIQGCWVDDITAHVIRCNTCGQAYTCFCDTCHRNGGFRKGR